MSAMDNYMPDYLHEAPAPGGKIVHKHPAPASHECHPPGFHWGRKTWVDDWDNSGPGTLWQCDCGQYWTVRERLYFSLDKFVQYKGLWKPVTLDQAARILRDADSQKDAPTW